MANRIASPKVQRAAKKLVEYLEWDEFKSYSCNLEKDHIFLSVRIIRDWLGMAPEHHDEAEQIAETKAELAAAKNAA